MLEHSRPTRNRREFIQDAFCGFGSLAMASMLQRDPLPAAGMNPLAPKASHHEAKARAVIFLFTAGGPSQVETFDPKPLLNKLDGQPRPKEFGEAKYQFVKADAKLLGTKRTFKKYGRAGVEVLRPVSAYRRVHRRHRGPAGLPRQHGGAFRGAIRAVQRTHRTGLPQHGLVVDLRAGFGSRVASVVCGDARSRRRARSRAADVRQRFLARGLPANDVSSWRPAGLEP